jgi:cytochrome P450
MNTETQGTPKKSGKAGEFFKKHMDLIFKILRNTIPILRIKIGGKEIVLVTRFKDVQEVLSRPLIFNVTYDEMTQATVGGPYMLGKDGHVVNQRDKGIMRAFMQREDLPKIAEATATLVNDAVERQLDSGEIELVSTISRWVPARILDIYFGFPGPDMASLLRWSKISQHDIFFNSAGDPTTRAKIHQANIDVGVEMRTYTTELLRQRREQLRENPELDDVLSRLLKTQFPSSIGFDDERIIANILGILVGGIQTPNINIVNTLSELLKRPAIQELAAEAARENNDDLLYQYCWEALRFNPGNPFVVRQCRSDYTLASGTFRSKTIKAGSTVLASARSGMRDRRELQVPEAFCIDRPAYHYFHMGYGMHTCLGDQVAKQEMVQIIKRLLMLPNLRASGEINYFHGDDPSDLSPFPESYRLQFG